MFCKCCSLHQTAPVLVCALRSTNKRWSCNQTLFETLQGDTEPYELLPCTYSLVD